MAGEDLVNKCYAMFVRLRQAGRNREEAWSDMQADASALIPADRDVLLALIRSWEAKEGYNYGPSPKNDPYATQHKPPEGLKEFRDSMSSTRPVIRRIKPLAATPTEGAIECPTCHKPNPPGETYCRSCGSILAQVTAKKESGDTQPLVAPANETALFTDDMLLVLTVRDSGEVMRLRPRTNEMIIGRSSADSVMLPDVDLAPYGADSRGVSRLHAGIRRHGQTLVLTDLGSLNNTFVNGQRIYPHEVRVLNHGDEVRFGQLVVAVEFKKE